MKIMVSSFWTDEERQRLIRVMKADGDEKMQRVHGHIDAVDADEIRSEVYELCELMDFVEHTTSDVLERFRYRFDAYLVDADM